MIGFLLLQLILLWWLSISTLSPPSWLFAVDRIYRMDRWASKGGVEEWGNGEKGVGSIERRGERERLRESNCVYY